MNHAKSIKEMLNLPAGTRTVASNGQSSLTESQLFFGSQNWLENSQGASQDFSVSSKNSQQSSQEGSESKLMSYFTKPPLFGDNKEKNKFSGLLGKFEEDKEKFYAKQEIAFLVKESQNIKQTLSSIKQLVINTEANTAMYQTFFEKLDHLSAALESEVKLLRDEISQKFEQLSDSVNSQQHVLTELEEVVHKKGSLEELDTHLKSLKENLQSLREERDGDKHILEEALKMLSTVATNSSTQATTVKIIDSASQTSPNLEQCVSNILQNDQIEDSQQIPSTYEPHQPTAFQIRRRIFTNRQRRRKRRPLVPSQERKCMMSSKNDHPKNNDQKKTSSQQEQTLENEEDLNSQSLMPPGQVTRNAESIGCYIKPESSWSQESSSCESIPGIEPLFETYVNKSNDKSLGDEGDLWLLFES